MIRKNYIPAFSVLETVVSMVISAIIIGLIFIIFTILSERMIDFKDQNQYVADLNRMTYSFNKDIFESDGMKVSNEQITFNCYSGEVVKYTLYPTYFLRTKDEFIDTFAIPIKDFRIDTIKNNNKRIIFQKLTLNVDVDKEAMQLKFFKKIYSNQLIQKELKENEF